MLLNGGIVLSITYGITEEIYRYGNDSRKTYGIAVYSNAEEDGTATIVAVVHDVTTDADSLAALVELCNSLELSLCHLNDVVEDYISGLLII